MFPSRQEVENIKKRYPSGTRIKLMQMNDDPNPVPSGTEGTVTSVDGIGQVHTKWDNGRTLPVVVGVDVFKVIE